jgi:hypothetical protein
MTKTRLALLPVLAATIAVPVLAQEALRTTRAEFAYSRTEALAKARRSAEQMCFSQNGVRTYVSQTCDQVDDVNGEPAWECTVSFRCTGRR